MRSIVSAFHLLLAGMMSLGCTIWAGQAALNLSWDLGFYGVTSPGTAALGMGALIGLAFAGIQAAVAIAFIPGSRGASHAMVMVSMLLAWSMPWPVNLLLGLTGIAGVIEVWSRMPAAEPTDDDEA